MLVGKKKIKFKPSATSIAKEHETEPSSIRSTEATMQNREGRGGERKKVPAPTRGARVQEAKCMPQ